MNFPSEMQQCPKCDYGRFDQNLTKRLSVDVAHNLQTIDQATQQFYQALAQAKREKYHELRVVVGGNLINAEIGRVLEAERWKNQIHSFTNEPGNKGAYLVRLS